MKLAAVCGALYHSFSVWTKSFTTLLPELAACTALFFLIRGKTPASQRKALDIVIKLTPLELFFEASRDATLQPLLTELGQFQQAWRAGAFIKYLRAVFAFALRLYFTFHIGRPLSYIPTYYIVNLRWGPLNRATNVDVADLAPEVERPIEDEPLVAILLSSVKALFIAISSSLGVLQALIESHPELSVLLALFGLLAYKYNSFNGLAKAIGKLCMCIVTFVCATLTYVSGRLLFTETILKILASKIALENGWITVTQIIVQTAVDSLTTLFTSPNLRAAAMDLVVTGGNPLSLVT